MGWGAIVGGLASSGGGGGILQHVRGSANSLYNDLSSVVDSRNWLMQHYPDFWGKTYQDPGQTAFNNQQAIIGQTAQMMEAAKTRNQGQQQFDATLAYKREQDTAQQKQFQDWLGSQGQGAKGGYTPLANVYKSKYGLE